MRRGGEPGHVDADLGDDDRGRGRPDTGDLIQPAGRVSKRVQMRADLGIEGGDIGVHCVHPGQHPSQQEPVMIVEHPQRQPRERFLQLGNLAAQRGPRHRGQHLRVSFPTDQGIHHGPPRDTEDVGRDH